MSDDPRLELTSATREALSNAIGALGHKPALDQGSLARALGQALIEAAAYHAPALEAIQLGDGTRQPLYALGRELMQAMWPAQGAAIENALATVLAKIDSIQDPSARRAATELFAKLGHMHQMAGLMLRDLELSQSDTTIAKSFLANDRGKSAGLPYTRPEKAVEALNRPRFEMTFTAHPTNTNTLASMHAQRELAKALSAWKTDPAAEADIAQALRSYALTPLLPERDGQRPSFTVREETNTMLYHMNTLYEDLDRVYASYDDALHNRFKDSDHCEPYKPETLRLNLGFQSWGSSGDKDGNAKVNADTTLYALAQHHQQVLIRYDEELAKLPGLEEWKTNIAKARVAAHEVVTTVETTLDEGRHLDEATNDRLRKMLSDAVAPLNKEFFLRALQDSYQHSDGASKKVALDLLRHVHTFGFSFGGIEYRETAEEFARIVGELIPGYKDLDETARCTRLNKIISDPGQIAQLREKFRAIGAGHEGQPYSKDDVGPIAYQTRKRLELARDFPDAIRDHVLAECQNSSNLMEMLLLQHAVGTDDGRRAQLGIVPLFEDSDTLEKSPEILKNAFAQPAYSEHVEALGKLRDGAKQQVQLAHSDNTRRNGIPAARALIYQTHDRLNELFKNMPAELQFYEGGSLSDSYRGGGRSISAATNEFGLHAFTKMTVQGGDMLNYLNMPDSAYRMIMRNISHNARRLDSRTVSHAQGSIGNEEPIIRALAASKDDYKTLFHSAELNDFLSAIGFAEESQAGNVSSRAGARANGGAVDATKARTITFSESMQHAGLNPSWIGSLPLPGLLAKEGIDPNDPILLKQIYANSPIYKDVVDRLLFGLMRTDMSYLRERSDGHPLMERFEKEYGVAFKLAMESYTGKPVRDLTGGIEVEQMSSDQQHQLLIDTVYPHVKPELQQQDNFITAARHFKRQLPEAANDNGVQSILVHNALDTILHGRVPLIDDPTYATEYCKNRGIVRPFGPKAEFARAA